jgi:hypothetical protein
LADGASKQGVFSDHFSECTEMQLGKQFDVLYSFLDESKDSEYEGRRLGVKTGASFTFGEFNAENHRHGLSIFIYNRNNVFVNYYNNGLSADTGKDLSIC